MDGILIVNKPKGYTSHDVVNVIRKKLNLKKVGHTGTLDPNATGVLPILIGQATKISKYLIEHDKTYIAELKLGKKSNTGDEEGEIIETKTVPKLDEEKIKKVLDSFIGRQEQIPPIYSAVKINGKKAYEYARENKEVKLEPREIEIYNIKFLEYKDNVIKFEVACSKGTYIRVLCEDIAKKLGTVGLMQNLIRTQVDRFYMQNAVNIDEIDEKNICKEIISVENIFEKKTEIRLNEKKTELFLNGVKLTYELPDDVYRIYDKTEFLGLGIVSNNLLKRDVIVRKSEIEK